MACCQALFDRCCSGWRQCYCRCTCMHGWLVHDGTCAATHASCLVWCRLFWRGSLCAVGSLCGSLPLPMNDPCAAFAHCQCHHNCLCAVVRLTRDIICGSSVLATGCARLQLFGIAVRTFGAHSLCTEFTKQNACTIAPRPVPGRHTQQWLGKVLLRGMFSTPIWRVRHDFIPCAAGLDLKGCHLLGSVDGLVL